MVLITKRNMSNIYIWSSIMQSDYRVISKQSARVVSITGFRWTLCLMCCVFMMSYGMNCLPDVLCVYDVLWDGLFA